MPPFERRSGRTGAAALALALAAPPLAAQDDRGDLARFFEAIDVRVVELEVVVLDRDGLPVAGLGRDDFEVAADGRPVPIAHFAAHSETGPASAPPPSAGEQAAPEAAAVEPLEPVTWLVFVDPTRLRAARRNAVLGEVGEFLAGALGPGDRSLVASFDGHGLRLASRLSDDPHAALDALDAVARSPVALSTLDEQSAGLRREINAADPLSINVTADKEQIRRDDVDGLELRGGTRALAASLLRQIEALGELEAQRTRAALEALGGLLALASGLEGRIGLLLVGAGYDSNVVDNLYRLWDSRFSELDLRSRAGLLGAREHEVAEAYARLLATLPASRTTIFTIATGEAAGLDVVDVAGAGTALGAGSAAAAASSEGRVTLAGLADATGGRTFAAGPDLGARLEAALEQLLTYYAIGVALDEQPTGPIRFEVRVRGEGRRAVHRTRRAFTGAEDQAAAAAISQLLGSAAAGESSLAVEVGAPGERLRGGEQVVPVTLSVPLAALTLSPDREVHRGALGYYLAVERPDGTIVRLEPRRLDFDVPNAQLQAALAESVAFRLELALPPGASRLGVAVLDRASGQRWTRAVRVEVDAPR